MSISFKDMDAVEAWSTQVMLPVGNHDVRITEADDSQPTSKGNDQIALRFEALDGGASIRDWLVVVPATYPKVRQLLDAVGILPESGEWSFDPAVLVGKELQIYVGEEDDRQNPGEKRRRVQAYKPAGDTSSNGSTESSSGDLPF